VGERGGLVAPVETSAEFRFLDETERQAVNRLDRARGELTMKRNSQDLRRLAFDPALKFGMAAAGRCRRKTEAVKDPEDLLGRQALDQNSGA
jgi:hypothetical protein